jgi:hypothetical protein
MGQVSTSGEGTRSSVDLSIPVGAFLLSVSPTAERIANQWFRQGVDRNLFFYLLSKMWDEAEMRPLTAHDAEVVQGQVAKAKRQMKKVKATLQGIEPAFLSQAQRNTLIDRFCEQIDHLIALLPALGGRPRLPGRPGEPQFNRLIFVMSRALKEATDRPQYSKITEVVNHLFGRQDWALKTDDVKRRCRNYKAKAYKAKEPDALETAREECRREVEKMRKLAG